jgi:transcriptional regulator with XRE-family HTH domain
MTPFGARVRRLRRERGITLKKMAGDLNLSPAYLSALEHGRRGRPAPGLVRQVCAYFDIIWDEAEELERLAALSHPLANRLAANIRDLPADTVKRLLAELKSASRRAPRLKG